MRIKLGTVPGSRSEFIFLINCFLTGLTIVLTISDLKQKHLNTREDVKEHALTTKPRQLILYNYFRHVIKNGVIDHDRPIT